MLFLLDVNRNEEITFNEHLLYEKYCSRFCSHLLFFGPHNSYAIGLMKLRLTVMTCHINHK